MIILKEFYFKDDNSIGQLQSQTLPDMNNLKATPAQIQ
jgi:hypothetical protein